VLAVAGLAYFMLSGSSAVTTMPDVVGQQVAVATTTLNADGFTITTTSVASKKPAGQVISSDPKAGAHVSKGQAVKLVVSIGTTPASVTIPDVTTMNLSDAESTLQSLGLNYKTQFTSTLPVGGASPNTVLQQLPAGGTNGHAGDVVILTLLQPGTPYALPSVVGQTVPQAASILGQSGLTVSASSPTVCSNTVKQGLVANTNPAPNSLVKAGSAVQLITSSGYCPVIVRNVLGDFSDNATSILSAQGFVIGSVTSVTDPACTTSQSGIVMTQSLAGGNPQPYGSTIDLGVCP
jgi:eukaryotic-like serine/threonine-protein kinase